MKRDEERERYMKRGRERERYEETHTHRKYRNLPQEDKDS